MSIRARTMIIGFYRYLLPALILYGLVVLPAIQPRVPVLDSPGWDLAVRLYIAAGFCAQSWIVGGTGIAQRWQSHYWQPWPEIQRDAAFVIWHGLMATMSLIIHGLSAFLVARAFVPSAEAYAIGIGFALGILYTVPLLTGHELWPV
jgi:hypothetical protein